MVRDTSIPIPVNLLGNIEENAVKEYISRSRRQFEDARHIVIVGGGAVGIGACFSVRVQSKTYVETQRLPGRYVTSGKIKKSLSYTDDLNCSMMHTQISSEPKSRLLFGHATFNLSYLTPWTASMTHNLSMVSPLEMALLSQTLTSLYVFCVI
jgi:hypothetical protein